MSSSRGRWPCDTGRREYRLDPTWAGRGHEWTSTRSAPSVMIRSRKPRSLTARHDGYSTWWLPSTPAVRAPADAQLHVRLGALARPPAPVATPAGAPAQKRLSRDLALVNTSHVAGGAGGTRGRPRPAGVGRRG